MQQETQSLQALLEQNQLLKQEIEDYRKEALEYEKELEDDNEFKQKEIEKLQKKLETATSKLDEFKKENNQMNIIIDREKDKAEKRSEELNSLKTKVVCLEQYIEALENQVRHSEFEKEEFRERFNGLEEEFILQRESFLEELTAKDEELERLRQDILDFQTEIHVLKSGRRTDSAEKSHKNNQPEILVQTKSMSMSDRTPSSAKFSREFHTTASKGVKANKLLAAEKSKSIGNFGRMRCQSATKPNQQSPLDKHVSDIYKLRPLVGSGISYLWDRFFDNKHINDDLKKEINQLFNKIQGEIQFMLENRIEKIKSQAHNLVHVQENAQLKQRIGDLCRELNDEKTVNARLLEEFTKLKHSERTQETTYGELETRANLETEGDDRTSFFKDSHQDFRIFKDSNIHLKSDIEQKQKTIKGLDDTLFELEKELKEITGSYSSVTVSSFNCSAEKDKNAHLESKIDLFKQSSPIEDIHTLEPNLLTGNSGMSRHLKPEDL